MEGSDSTECVEGASQTMQLRASSHGPETPEAGAGYACSNSSSRCRSSSRANEASQPGRPQPPEGDEKHSSDGSKEHKRGAGAASLRGFLTSWAPLVALLVLLAGASGLAPPQLRKTLLWVSAASVVAFAAADWLMPVLGRKLLGRGFFGRDLHKPASAPPVPEAGGLCCIFCFLSAATAGQLLLDRHYQRLVEYPAALLGATSMAFLGFADDALALPWRVKLLLPLLAATPILAAYSGNTTIVLPAQVYSVLQSSYAAAAAAANSVFPAVAAPCSSLADAVGSLLKEQPRQQPGAPLEFEGLLPHTLSVGATAFAGLSSALHEAVDVARCLPLAEAVKTHCARWGLRSTSGGWVLVEVGALYYMYMTLLTIFCTNAINIYAGINGLEVGQSVIIASFVCIHNLIEVRASLAAQEAAEAMAAQQHFLSLIICLPFLATSLALLKHNWYPSRIFVGDTYTYFAGVVLAATGILGHFSKTLLLFFIPQCINFLLSLPQLLGLLRCPRHRTPRYLEDSGMLVASGNLTLINAVLWAFGPMREERLLCWLLLLQAACCVLGLVVRYNMYTFFLFT